MVLLIRYNTFKGIINMITANNNFKIIQVPQTYCLQDLMVLQRRSHLFLTLEATSRLETKNWLKCMVYHQMELLCYHKCNQVAKWVDKCMQRIKETEFVVLQGMVLISKWHM